MRRIANLSILAAVAMAFHSRAAMATNTPSPALSIDEECVAVDASSTSRYPYPGSKGCKEGSAKLEPGDYFFFDGDDVEGARSFSESGSTLAITSSGDHQVVVQVDGREVASFKDPGGVEEPIKAAYWHKKDWILEYLGKVLVSGHDIGSEQGYIGVFYYRFIDDRPFYFFIKPDGSTGISFDGKELPVHYDAVAHDLCCEAGAHNPVRSASAVKFFARRWSTWYHVTARARPPTEDETTQKVEGIITSLNPPYHNNFYVGTNGENWSMSVSSQTKIVVPEAEPSYGDISKLHLGQSVTARLASRGVVRSVVIHDVGQAGSRVSAEALEVFAGGVVSFDSASQELTLHTHPPDGKVHKFVITPKTDAWCNGEKSPHLGGGDFKAESWVSLEYRPGNSEQEVVRVSVSGPRH